MGTVYREFTTTPANLVADLRTNILLSTDWSQPNASLPGLVKTVTGRGATIAVDFNAVAPTVQVGTFDVFASHDGTTAGPSVRKFLRYKRVSSGTTATVNLHVVLSAGRDHLFVSIEGPWTNEANTDSGNYGSIRNYLAISEITSYFDLAADPAPCVGVVGRQINGGPSWTNGSYDIYVSRNRANNQSWVKGKVLSLDPVVAASFGGTMLNGNRQTVSDGNYYLSPYVVAEDADGFRGRLGKLFMAGWNNQSYNDIPPPPQGQIVTYGGEQYRLIAANKSDATEDCYDALGIIANGSGGAYANSPVVAVPYA